MLWNWASQPDDIHVTCFCLYYSPQTEAFCSFSVFFSPFCFLISSKLQCYCLGPSGDQEQRDAVSLPSGPPVPLHLSAFVLKNRNFCAMCAEERGAARQKNPKKLVLVYFCSCFLFFFFSFLSSLAFHSLFYLLFHILHMQPFLCFCITHLIIAAPARCLVLFVYLIGWVLLFSCNNFTDHKTNYNQ